MLLLSLYTHINVFVGIPDFVIKGKVNAAARASGLVVQTALTGLFFYARDDGATWPYDASSLAIMPAACFYGLNSTSIDGGFFQALHNITSRAVEDANATVASDPTILPANGGGELTQFWIAAGFIILTAGVVIIDSFDKPPPNEGRVPLWKFCLVVIVSGGAKVAMLVFMILTFRRYKTLRSEMEVDSWFQIRKQTNFSYSSILQMFLVGSVVFMFVKALRVSITHMTEKDGRHVAKEARDLGREMDEENRQY